MGFLFSKPAASRPSGSKQRGAAGPVTDRDTAVLELKVARDKLQQYKKRVRTRRAMPPAAAPPARRCTRGDRAVAWLQLCRGMPARPPRCFLCCGA